MYDQNVQGSQPNLSIKFCRCIRPIMVNEANESDKPEAIRIYITNPSLLLIPACAASFGFVSGLLTAGQRASLQFLAENAHRQPTTLQGWYFYNKTKNYRVALASVKGALATAGRMGGWTGAFVGLQEGFKRVTGWQEAQSGAASGTVLALAATTLCMSSDFRLFVSLLTVSS